MDDLPLRQRRDANTIETLLAQPAKNWTPEQSQLVCSWVHKNLIDRLHHTAYMVLNNWADAEEVVTDLYAEFAHQVRGFDPARAKLETFLRRVVRNRAVDYLRSHRRERAEVSLESPRGSEPGKDDWTWDFPDAAPGGGDVSRTALPEDRTELLMWLAEPVSDALQTLREKNAQHAEALWHSVAGMKSSDIGKALGCNDGAARQYVSRGKKFLREYLLRRGFDWSIEALDKFHGSSGAAA